MFETISNLETAIVIARLNLASVRKRVRAALPQLNVTKNEILSHSKVPLVCVVENRINGGLFSTVVDVK